MRLIWKYIEMINTFLFIDLMQERPDVGTLQVRFNSPTRNAGELSPVTSLSSAFRELNVNN